MTEKEFEAFLVKHHRGYYECAVGWARLFMDYQEKRQIRKKKGGRPATKQSRELRELKRRIIDKFRLFRDNPDKFDKIVNDHIEAVKRDRVNRQRMIEDDDFWTPVVGFYDIGNRY